MRRLLPLTLIAAVAAFVVLAAWPDGGASEFAATPALAVGEMCTPAKPQASGTVVQNVNTPGGSRSYRLHVPASYSGSDPVPLVLSIHGANSSGLEQEVYSGFSAKSDSEGFIVAYPEGSVASISFVHFNAWQLTMNEPDDVAYMDAIITQLVGQLCIDQSRVYSTGMSNGAMMSVRLACSLSHRIAAIGPVAGAYYPADSLVINPAETCPDTAPRPVIAFHGTADDTVPYNGGGTIQYRLPLDDNTPAEDVIADWAAHNGCAGARQETVIDTEVTLIEYGSCTDGAAVQLYRVDPGGHTWPGSFDVPSLGYTTHQIVATDLIWSFFEQFTLPDADVDLIPDAADNCRAAANFDQLNTDRNFVDNSPPYAPSVDDRTWIRSDVAGDACDDDDDNDGLTDAQESSGVLCAGAVATDPLLRDTDGDRFLDGAECILGAFDPTNPASHPALADCAPAGDADGDGLSWRAEMCFYNSSDGNVDSDGDATLDGATDGCEVASLNGDRIVNSIDQGMLAQGISGSAGYTTNTDLNKDGVLNSIDQGMMASFIVPPGQCPG